MAKPSMDSPLWFRLNHDDLTNQVDGLKFNELPPVLPHFFVPTLQDKPQNPILDNIKLSQKNREPTKDYKPKPFLPPELRVITDDLIHLGPENEDHRVDFVWDKPEVYGNSRKVHALRFVNSK